MRNGQGKSSALSEMGVSVWEVDSEDGGSGNGRASRSLGKSCS